MLENVTTHLMHLICVRTIQSYNKNNTLLSQLKPKIAIFEKRKA